MSWSPTSRYLAVELSSNAGDGGSLAIVDTMTNTVKTIASGSICGASFAPTSPERLVYGRGPTQSFCTKSDIYSVAVDGSGLKQLTHGGRSLNPVWGAGSIAFDREKLRKLSPLYQIWLMQPDGSKAFQLTHTSVPSLLLGLVPQQFSASGKRLLAEFEGQDTSETWTIDIASKRARHLTVRRQDVVGRRPLARRQDGADRLRWVREPTVGRNGRDDSLCRRAGEGARQARVRAQLEQVDARRGCPTLPMRPGVAHEFVGDCLSQDEGLGDGPVVHVLRRVGHLVVVGQGLVPIH